MDSKNIKSAEWARGSVLQIMGDDGKYLDIKPVREIKERVIEIIFPDDVELTERFHEAAQTAAEENMDVIFEHDGAQYIVQANTGN